MQDNLTFSLHDLGNSFMSGVLVGRKSKHRAPYFDFGVSVSHKPKQKGSGPMLKVSLTNEQQVKVTLTPRTPSGKPATIDGKATFEVVSGDSTVVAADDGLSAMIVSSDTPGVSEISVKADADLGEGVEEIADFIEVTVNGARASNLGLVLGEPELKA